MAVARGAHIGRYEPKGRNWVKLIVNGLLIALFGMLSLVLLTLTVITDMSLGVFGALALTVAVLGFLIVYFTVSKPPPAFDLYENGGALIQPDGTEKLAFNWADVSDIHPITYRPGTGAAAGAAAGGVVGALAGAAIDAALQPENPEYIDVKEIRLEMPQKRIVLNQRYQDAARMCAEVRRIALQSWQAEALRQIKNGQPVTFGQVTVTHTGIQHKGQAIAWKDVMGSPIEANAAGYFVVIEYRTDAQQRDQKIRVPLGYRGKVLVAIINEMKG